MGTALKLEPFAFGPSMFGKKPPPPDALAQRVRAIAERTPVSAPKSDRAPRQNVFRNGSVLLDSGARFTVAIKDLSEGGARIEFFQDLPLDGEFVLSEPVMKLRRRARITWRKDLAAGLVFID
jgi:hypothetical protein